jgi:hypothetical protein
MRTAAAPEKAMAERRTRRFSGGLWVEPGTRGARRNMRRYGVMLGERIGRMEDGKG